MSWEDRGGRVVNDLMRDFDLSREQAAGVVGNLGFESAGFQKLQELAPVAGRGGFGWAQWTGPRRRAFEKWCDLHQLDEHTDAANYGYLVEELNGQYFYCLKALEDEDTLERCTFVFGVKFEAPGGTTATHLPGYEGRLSYAKRAYEGSQKATG